MTGRSNASSCNVAPPALNACDSTSSRDRSSAIYRTCTSCNDRHAPVCTMQCRVPSSPRACSAHCTPPPRCCGKSIVLKHKCRARMRVIQCALCTRKWVGNACSSHRLMRRMCLPTGQRPCARAAARPLCGATPTSTQTRTLHVCAMAHACLQQELAQTPICRTVRHASVVAAAPQASCTAQCALHKRPKPVEQPHQAQSSRCFTATKLQQACSAARVGS